MPKLETTINNLELKTNKVSATYPSVNWTDEQYPSAKTLYNIFQQAKGNAHPVQALLTTYANQPPQSFVGIGTWEIVDKEFTYSRVCLNELTDNVWTPNTNDTGANINLNYSFLTRCGKFIYLDLRLETNESLSNTEVTLGSLNPSTIGLSGMTDVTVLNSSNVAFSEDGKYQIKYIAGAGMYNKLYITSMAGLDLTSGSFQVPANTSIDVQITLLASPEAMLDNCCDKFHWKRTV